MSDLAARPAPTLAPMLRLIDSIGLVEHADGACPAPRHGYCTDDAGRGLLVACRSTEDEHAERVATACLSVLVLTARGEGRFVLRLGPDGRPTKHPQSDDACGRAICGLGAAVAHASWPTVRDVAETLFEQCGSFTSIWPRAIAHAAIGAAAVHTVDPGNPAARELLERAHTLLPRPRETAWVWPETRLSYSNGLLCESLLAVGAATGDLELIEDGLDLLAWLAAVETSSAGHLSVTPVGGWAPGEPRPGFDQQPIEAWALAEAARLAFELTRDDRWRDVVDSALRWFMGANDTGVPMWDRANGAGFDGLTASGVNENQGAESGLALIGTSWCQRWMDEQERAT